MAGNTGLWIGFTAVSVGEFLLIAIQLVLWICTKTKELPEVPSCRHRNYTFEGDDDEENDSEEDNPASRSKQKISDAGWIPAAESGAFGSAGLALAATADLTETVPRHRLPPKSFDNGQSLPVPGNLRKLSDERGKACSLPAP